MEFSIKTQPLEAARTGCIVAGVYSGNELTPAAQRLDRAAQGALRKALGDLSGKPGSTLLLRALPGIAAERVLLVGLGKRGDLGEAHYRDAVRGAAGALRGLGARDAVLTLVDVRVRSRTLAWNLRHAVLLLREAFYRFDQLKSQKKAPASALQHVALALVANAELRQALAEAVATADGV